MSDKKILIVDDNSLTRDTLARFFSASGYAALKAVDGSQAVSIARHERPDLILLDLIFPPDVGSGGGVAWDGFLIMDWLHRLEEAKDIPVFVMTMGKGDHYRNTAFAKGAAAFFPKPINQEELLAAVRSILGEPELPPAEPDRPALPPGWTYLGP